MKVTTFGKASAGLAAALSLSLGVCTSAFATPGGPTANQEDAVFGTATSTTLVGVGSDTIQDVMYGIAKNINTAEGKQYIQSFTATGTPATLTYRSTSTFTRPNGSGPGYAALSESIGRIAGGVTAKPGDVDFARASGTQGTQATGTSGVVTEIPFAIDSMSFAVPAGSPFALTNSGKGLTAADLLSIYNGTNKYVDTTTGALSAAAGANTKPIWGLLPKAGSGSREFFLKNLVLKGSGLPSEIQANGKGDPATWDAAPTAGQPYVGNQINGTTQIQEHDATALVNAPSTVAAIAPFSGAKFIGYHNGKVADPATGKVAGTDYVLVPFDNAGTPVLPFTGNQAVSAENLAPNAAYATGAVDGTVKFTREVYNIIPTAAVKAGANSSNPKYKALYDTFVGASSKVCQAATTITEFGFGLDSNCGSTAFTADSYSTATVTPSASAATPGGSSTVTVGVQSIGNGGGTVAVVANGATYTGVIAANATSTTVSVPTPAAGTVSYTAQFTPNLAAVAPAQATGTITVAAPYVAPPSLGSVSISGKAKVGKKLTAAVAPAGLAGLKYQWFSNGKKIKKATKSSLKLTKKLKKKKISVKVTYAGVTKASKAVKVK